MAAVLPRSHGHGGLHSLGKHGFQPVGHPRTCRKHAKACDMAWISHECHRQTHVKDPFLQGSQLHGEAPSLGLASWCRAGSGLRTPCRTTRRGLAEKISVHLAYPGLKACLGLFTRILLSLKPSSPSDSGLSGPESMARNRSEGVRSGKVPGQRRAACGDTNGSKVKGSESYFTENNGKYQLACCG